MRRIAFYLLYDAKGIVDPYIVHMMSELRKHVDTIIAVSNGPISEAGRASVLEHADRVWLHENIGFDVWAYKDALERFGWDALGEYDEIILLNYTFFGPIGGFEELFANMDAASVDFWGITEHAAYSPNPITGSGTMPAHIQSHWIAIRKSLHQSEDFQDYWTSMPMISSYNDSILYHESRFTKHFSDLGYSYRVAYPASDFPSPHPIFDNAELMLERGCPILKRRVFFHDPFYLDRHGVLGGRLIEIAQERGYPVELLWQNLARTTPPRILQANTGGTVILDPDAATAELPQPPRVLAIAHVYYPDLADEIFTAFAAIPGTPKLVITTSDETRKRAIAQIARQRNITDIEIRVVASNRGRDVGAFLITCEDLLLDDSFEFVVKLHSKKSEQDEFMVGKNFRDHLVQNLLPSPDYARQLFRLLTEQPTIGMVFPPVIASGYPTLGHGWFGNRDGVLELLGRMNLAAQVDSDTPLSPLGSMFICRREVLRPFVELGLTWADFPDSSSYGDGTLAHIIERAYSYAAAAQGKRIITVMSSQRAGREFAMTEYKLQRLAQFLPAWPEEQAQALAEGAAVPPLLQVVKRRVRARYPQGAKQLTPLYALLRSIYRKLRVTLATVRARRSGG